LNDYDRQNRFHMLRIPVKEKCGRADERLSLSRHELELFGMAQAQDTSFKAAELVKSIDREPGCEALAAIREMVMEHYPDSDNQVRMRRPDSSVAS